MKYCSERKRILLIDNQPYWRDLSARALQEGGFCVRTMATYNQASLQDHLQREEPDLIVLGCTRIREEEQYLIEQVLHRKQHLLVLCASLSWQIMRSLFRIGVADIVDKPYDPARLIKIVDKALASTMPRNAYQAVERASV